MREIKQTYNRYTTVHAGDERTVGNACHEYFISRKGKLEITPAGEFGHVKFQEGPILKSKPNGCYMEDLLAIVIDRLEGFQSGDYPCRENALALTKIQEAVHWLNHRTNDRIERNVEGRFEK